MAIEPLAGHRHIAGMTAKPPAAGQAPAPHRRDKPALSRPALPPEEAPARPREIGGPKGPEPTRYGDWEVNGRCTDF